MRTAADFPRRGLFDDRTGMAKKPTRANAPTPSRVDADDSRSIIEDLNAPIAVAEPPEREPQVHVVGTGDRVRPPTDLERLRRQTPPPSKVFDTLTPEQKAERFIEMVDGFCVNKANWEKLSKGFQANATTGAKLFAQELLDRPADDGKPANLSGILGFTLVGTTVEDRCKSYIAQYAAVRANAEAWAHFQPWTQYAAKGAETLAREITNTKDSNGHTVTFARMLGFDLARVRTIGHGA
jgi:hypothetical protein